MTISRNDRTATYVNNAVRVFQLVIDDGDPNTEERIAYTGAVENNSAVFLHGASKSTGSAGINATVTPDHFAGTIELDGRNAAATPANGPLVVDIHYKEIVQFKGAFTTDTRPVGNEGDVIWDSNLVVYFRHENGVWSDKGPNYQQPGIVLDVFSSLSIAISEGSVNTPMSVNQAAWEASMYGDATRDPFQDGATIDLRPFINDFGGTGTIFANVVIDDDNTVSDVTVTINQTTGILTIRRGNTDGPFRIDWGIS